MSIADHFEYSDLALTIDRGAMGQPSTVTLDWLVVDDNGDEQLRKLTLACELLIDTADGVRELSVVSVYGDSDAVADFRRYIMIYEGHILDDGDYDNERMFDIAEGLGRALLLKDAKDRYPTLFVKVLP
jgi:hypothetical protein